MSENKNILIMKRPASWYKEMWREGIPIGNGIMGALVYGGVAEENILINRFDLWHWGSSCDLPNVSYTLELAREAMDRGEFEYANNLLSKTLNEKGYNAIPSTPFPLANLRVNMKNEVEFSHYRRKLDMETGEVTVSYYQGNIAFNRRTFVSRSDNVLVYEISSTENLNDIKIFLEMFNDDSNDYRKMLDETSGSLIITIDGSYIYYTSKNDDNSSYGAVLKVVDGTLNNENYLKNSQPNKVLVIVKTYANGESTIEKSKEEIDAISTNYDDLLERHIALHKPLYNSADLCLYGTDDGKSNEELLLEAYDDTSSNTLLEKMWRFGRYLFISGTSKYPFPLYGLWHGEYCPGWAQNVANENVQMIYWHLHTGGLIEFVKPLIDYYFDKIKDFKKSAKHLFGCDGIFVSTYTTPVDSLPNPVVPVIMNWIGGAGWLSRHFYEYYLATNDEVLLNEKILPFMLETARFYTDYVVYDEKMEIKIYPSVSPENSPANFMPEDYDFNSGHCIPVVKNATMDFAIMKEFFTNFLKICNTKGIYIEEKIKWEKILKSIPKYKTNSDGAIKEWIDDDLRDYYCHRHLSHIYPVFPGNEIEKNPTLIKAFETAVDLREIRGQSGWSLAHMASIYARFNRGDDSIKCIDTLIKGVTLNNLFTMHNDYRDMGVTLSMGQLAPIQLDANMGIINAIQEMILYVGEDIVKFIPALPSRFYKGSVKQFHFYTGEVDFNWNKQIGEFSAIIKSTDNTEIIFHLPEYCRNFSIVTNEKAEFECNGLSLKVKMSIGGEIKVN